MHNLIDRNMVCTNMLFHSQIMVNSVNLCVFFFHFFFFISLFHAERLISIPRTEHSMFANEIEMISRVQTLRLFGHLIRMRINGVKLQCFRPSAAEEKHFFFFFLSFLAAADFNAEIITFTCDFLFVFFSSLHF